MRTGILPEESPRLCLLSSGGYHNEKNVWIINIRSPACAVFGRHRGGEILWSGQVLQYGSGQLRLRLLQDAMPHGHENL